MIQTIGLSQFRDAFHHAGRGKQFSYEGLEILFDALEDAEHGREEPIELDVIGLCCEFSEMTRKELEQSYPQLLDYDIDGVWEYLTENTWLCGQTSDGKFVFQQF